MTALQRQNEKQAIMGPERSYWSSSHFRHVMLTEIGEAIKDYYTVSQEPLAPNVVELLTRLDDDDASGNRRSPSPSRK